MPNCTCGRQIRKPGETKCHVHRGVTPTSTHVCTRCGKRTRSIGNRTCLKCRDSAGIRHCLTCRSPMPSGDGAQRCERCVEKREKDRMARGVHRPDIGIENDQVVKINAGPWKCGWRDNGEEPCGQEILVLGVDGWYRPGGIAVCLEHEAAYSRKMQETT